MATAKSCWRASLLLWLEGFGGKGLLPLGFVLRKGETATLGNSPHDGCSAAVVTKGKRLAVEQKLWFYPH